MRARSGLGPTSTEHHPGGEVPIACSVLTPVLNEERHIAATIAAMQRQVFDGRLEFLIIDAGSSDRTREIVAEMARDDDRIVLLSNPRRGTPSGLNVGLREARGRWVARMDGHTEYPPDYLALGVARLAEGDTAWVCGPQVPRGSGPVSRAVAAALRTPLGRGGSRKWAASIGEAGDEFELDSGVFCGVWERDVLLRSGGWDESFVRNQDSEMAGRFLAQGERIVCLPAMAAAYTPRDSLRGLWRQYREYGSFRARTAARHPATLRRSALLPPAVPLAIVSAAVAPRPLRAPARTAVGAYLGGLAAAGVWAIRQGEAPGEGLLVPVVLATMHLAHGVGFLVTAFRDGPPVAALLHAVGARGLAARLPVRAGEVYAPSLRRTADGSGRENEPALDASAQVSG